MTLPNEIQLPDNRRYGSLLSSDIKIFRKWFEELVTLQGIQVIYYQPKPGKHYTTYGEISANYYQPQVVGVLFNDHPDQKSMKKLGWNAELQDDASVIHVPYDLPGIQAGALFVVPSGIDQTKGRLFRVTQLSTGMVYPASVACEIVPEYQDQLPTTKRDVSKHDFNLLRQEDGDQSF